MSAAVLDEPEVHVVTLRDDALAYLDVWPGSPDQPEVSVYVEPKTDTLTAAQARDLAGSLMRAAEVVEALRAATA